MSTRTGITDKKPTSNHAQICNSIAGDMKSHGQMVELAKDFRKGTLIGGSDASVVHGRGTGVWMITKITNMTTKMEGEGPIDGNPTSMHSTRAERGATIGCLWALYVAVFQFCIATAQEVLYAVVERCFCPYLIWNCCVSVHYWCS